MTIKQILKDANRYKDVMEVLYSLHSSSKSDYPVEAYDAQGYISFRVNGQAVNDGAFKVIQCIESNAESLSFTDDLDPLYQYIKTSANTILHNYAISVTHRIEPIEDIDKARIYLIIQNIIDCGKFDDIPWSIPDGWKTC